MFQPGHEILSCVVPSAYTRLVEAGKQMNPDARSRMTDPLGQHAGKPAIMRCLPAKRDHAADRAEACIVGGRGR
jgi:hypothetical protein